MDAEKFFLEDIQQEEEEGLDLQRYLRGLYRRKWMLLAIFLVILIPWLIYVKKQPPQYEASALIRFKTYGSDNVGLLNETRITELTSRTFAEKVVAQLGLTLEMLAETKERPLRRQKVFEQFSTTTDPISGEYLLEFKDDVFSLFQLNELDKAPRLLVSDSLSKIIDQTYDVNGFSFRINPDILKERSRIHFRVKNFRRTVDNFRKQIKVRFNRTGTLMWVSLTDRDPSLVATMVNQLAQMYVEESKFFSLKKVKDVKEVVENQLKIAKENLDKANEELKRFKESHFISLDTEVKQNVNDLSDLENEIRTIKENIESLSLLLRRLEKNFETTEASETRYIYRQIARHPAFQQDPNMGILQQQLADLESQRDQLLTRVTESHQDVVEINAQIKFIQLQIKDLAKKRLEQLYEELATAERTASNLRYKLKMLPSEQLKLAELTQKVKVNEDIYSSLLAKYQEAQISEAVRTEEISILDPAQPPEDPVNRDKKQKAVIGGFFSLFFSIFVGVFLEFLDKTLKTPDDIKRYLKLNVIGSIPKIEFDHEYELKDADKIKQIDAQLVTYDYSPTPVSEAYRALRTKIMFSKQTGNIRTLVITSFAPYDGKSFTCSNLAVTLAQHKTNTLLVDADLRRGVLHNTFSVPKEPGLSNFLMGMVSFEELLNETHVPNLTVVSCGSMMPNPSELLGSLRLRKFIDEAKRRFDFVIFDTPPLNAATDAVVLGTQVDGVTLIVRAGKTNRNIARQKLDLFDNVPATIIGVIINGAEKDLAHEGYSYYHY